MKYVRLGTSDLTVSEVCLGTMTWGMQNTEADAHAQIDYARSRGINFIDTAETYPVPVYLPESIPGLTEQYIGTYLAAHPEARSELIIATKVSGYKEESRAAANREESDVPLLERTPFPTARLDDASVKAACDASLRRLQTTYIDLYQLHWPDRYVPTFGERGYSLACARDNDIPIRDTLLALKGLLESGKIRAYGLSNETTFGVCEFVRVADELGMPRPATIQNSFCLFDRAFECELAEACSPRNYNIALLPWSILAGGTLTGKYRYRLHEPHEQDQQEKEKEKEKELENARFVKYPHHMTRFHSQPAIAAAAQYEDIAKTHGMSVATLAQAFCKSRWYVTSSIIGATSLGQLKENIDAFDVELDDIVLKKIDVVYNNNKDLALTA